MINQIRNQDTDHQWHFSLQLAAHELDAIVDTLQTTYAALAAIRVMVTVTLSNAPDKALFFDYRLTIDDEPLVAHLDWSDWHTEQVRFTDYLWQETCLECFIAPKDSRAYIEMNASPDGRYALYQFDDYRSPNTLPPPAVQHPEQGKARIHWQPLPTDSDTAKNNTYCRCFSLPLSTLDAVAHDFYPTQIHPCVILKFGDCHLYFAPEHPYPPDFHNKDYWTALQ